MCTKMRILLFFTTLAVSKIVSCQGSECKTISVKGSNYQAERHGTYIMQTYLTCSGKAVWKQEDGANYIFYYSLIDEWLISDQGYCSSSAGVRSGVTYTSSPDQYAGSWEEYNGYSWVSSPIDVSCDEGLSTGAIVGIVIGCLVFVGIIVSIGVCSYFFCCKDNTVNPSVHQPHMQQLHVHHQQHHQLHPQYQQQYPQQYPQQANNSTAVYYIA